MCVDPNGKFPFLLTTLVVAAVAGLGLIYSSILFEGLTEEDSRSDEIKKCKDEDNDTITRYGFYDVDVDEIADSATYLGCSAGALNSTTTHPNGLEGTIKALYADFNLGYSGDNIGIGAGLYLDSFDVSYPVNLFGKKCEIGIGVNYGIGASCQIGTYSELGLSASFGLKIFFNFD